MCLIIRFYLKRENERREQILIGHENASDGDEAIDVDNELVKIGDQDLDRTDREDLKFIYPL